ncbi:hypothetical protein [Pyruvatibacter sp.]|uniref:hypothetical protein n=1 Tax=Pyruvatibacter sp. TaxID=1981328 RepID=UPI003267D82E
MGDSNQKKRPFWQQPLLADLPIGPFWTGLVVSLAVFASACVVLWFQGNGWAASQSSYMAELNSDSWAAFVISLFIWAFISANGIAGKRNLADLKSLAEQMRGVDLADLEKALQPSVKRQRFAMAATLIGLPIGAFIFLNQRIAGVDELGYFDRFSPFAVWSLTATTLLTAAVLRWVVLARGEVHGLTSAMEDRIEIDLLDNHHSEVVAGIALRGALVWLMLAAILLLLFVWQPLNAVLMVTFAAIVLIAVLVFMGPLRWMHALLTRTQKRELASVRAEIKAARNTLKAGGRDADSAAMHLPGLLAYEARIRDVSVWSLDFGTLIRFLGLLTIPVLSWTGGAFAERTIDWLLG